MNALVGYTGFVGSNLHANGQFEAVYNSKNILDAYGTRPDLLVFSGLRAEKYLANREPSKDMELVKEAENNIQRIHPEKLVLISTIDVFKIPSGVDEDSDIDTEGLHAYGYNRYQLELWVRENYPDALTIRLPALFGKNIKKNFIYDYINVIPFMLGKGKFEELAFRQPVLRDYYVPQDNGFFKVDVSDGERERLKMAFRSLGFSALNFTDSRSKYQFYNLEHLWTDMQTALRAGITLWHPAVEPVSAGELYHYLTGREFINELDGVPAAYDYRTVYSKLFGGEDGYISPKSDVLNEIDKFIQEESKWKYKTLR